MASDTKPTLAGKTLIIVGAGIAGLAFPLALHQQWPSEFAADFPSILIYERDDIVTPSGREGYTISIRGDALAGGMQALKKMGILDQMLEVSVFGPPDTASEHGSFCIWDLDWNPLLQVTAGNIDDLPAPSMRIRRDALRKVLIEAVSKLDRVSIQWNTPCLGVDVIEKIVSVSVEGENHQVQGDYLIVAEGAGSKIRAQLRPQYPLNFTGICIISGTARFPDGKVPQPMDKNWGGVLGGNGVGLFVSVVDANSALWSLSYSAREPRVRFGPGMPPHMIEGVLQEALNLAESFNKQPLETLIKATDTSTLAVFNATDRQPFSHSDASPVVFIGDSNHAVSPFAGNGANMALCDAWDLAEQLCQPVQWQQALHLYDARSMPRSARTINMSHWSISLLHARGFKLYMYKLLLAVIRLFKR